MRLDDDAALARQYGRTPAEIEATRARAYAKIRAKMRERGILDVPDTDEGLYLWMQALRSGEGDFWDLKV